MHEIISSQNYDQLTVLVKTQSESQNVLRDGCCNTQLQNQAWPVYNIYLASERQKKLVKEFGCEAMTSVAFRSLDVLIHLPLRLEPLLQNISQLHPAVEH